MKRSVCRALWLVVLTGLVGHGCANQPQEPAGPATDRNDLAAMETAELNLNGQPFRVWMARTPQEREFGLMHVTAEQMAPASDGFERGMLFVFPHEQFLRFWMKNTIIPLDIAYMRADGTIVTTYTMPARETRTFPSLERARFALEINAGRLDALGLYDGDRIEIPDSLLKASR